MVFVLELQEVATEFITLENLEEEIEKALNKRINYNFAIDLDGNRYVEQADYSTEITRSHEDTKPILVKTQEDTLSEASESS